MKMRKLVLPLAAAAMVMSVGAAFASSPQTAAGKVESFNVMAHTVILDNGRSYNLPANFDMSKLHVGSSVVLVWEKIPNARIDQNADQVTNVLVKG